MKSKRCVTWAAAAIVLVVAPAARAGEEAQPAALTLGRAVAMAVAGHPALVEAGQRQAAAEASVRLARAEKGVQVRLDSRYTRLSKVASLSPIPGGPSISLGEKDSWTADLAAQKVIYSGGRLEALVHQAADGAKAAEASRSRAVQAVAFNAERAFRLLLAAQQSEEVARLSLAAAEEHLKAARDRFEAKAAARFDVLRAEVQVEESRQELIAAAAGLLTARAGLLAAVGLAEGEFTAVEPETSSAPRPRLEELLEQARLGRPEAAAAGWRIAAAAEGVKAARGESWPTVSLAADYLWADPESLMTYDRWAVAAVVTVPILDGGRRSARRESARAQQAQAEAARREVWLAIDAEVRQAYARAESSDDAVAVAGKRIEQAEELLRLANVRYAGGVGTAMEIADAQASLTRARQGLTSARAERGIAEAELRLAVGAPVPLEAGASREDTR